jgi:hydrogenase maturation protease
MRLVVFGWGNESRGDDGVGPLLLARIAAAGWPDTATVEDYQLQIEHALDLDGCDCALFVDAGKDTPAPFSFGAVAPRRATTHTSHALAPEAVLDVYAQIKGRAPPPAFALCVRGERFELGEGLSREGAERLEAAWAFVQALMRERSLAAWERAAPYPPLPLRDRGRGHRR